MGPLAYRVLTDPAFQAGTASRVIRIPSVSYGIIDSCATGSQPSSMQEAPWKLSRSHFPPRHGQSGLQRLKI